MKRLKFLILKDVNLLEKKLVKLYGLKKIVFQQIIFLKMVKFGHMIITIIAGQELNERKI
jgi:hypothetical protein